MKQVPNWLTKDEKSLWKQLAVELDERGDLSPATAEALGMLVKAYWRYRKANEVIDKEGLTITTPTTTKAHPAIAISKSCHDEVVRVMDQLKLLPKGKKEQQNSSETLDEFMGGQ